MWSGLKSLRSPEAHDAEAMILPIWGYKKRFQASVRKRYTISYILLNRTNTLYLVFFFGFSSSRRQCDNYSFFRRISNCFPVETTLPVDGSRRWRLYGTAYPALRPRVPLIVINPVSSSAGRGRTREWMILHACSRRRRRDVPSTMSDFRVPCSRRRLGRRNISFFSSSPSSTSPSSTSPSSPSSHSPFLCDGSFTLVPHNNCCRHYCYRFCINFPAARRYKVRLG